MSLLRMAKATQALSDSMHEQPNGRAFFSSGLHVFKPTRVHGRSSPPFLRLNFSNSLKILYIQFDYNLNVLKFENNFIHSSGSWNGARSPRLRPGVASSFLFIIHLIFLFFLNHKIWLLKINRGQTADSFFKKNRVKCRNPKKRNQSCI